MDPLTQPRILLDVFLFALIAVAIALPAFRQHRLTYPAAAWNMQGNVPSYYFTPLDLLGVSLTLLIYVSNIFAPFYTSPEMMEKAQHSSGAILIIGNIISQLIPVGITLLFLATRMNVLDVFGLKNINWKKIGLTAFLGLLGIYLGLFAVSSINTSVLTPLFGKREPQMAVKMMLEAKNGNPGFLIGIIFMACIVAPICEEIVFRGYLYGVIKRFSCPIFAAVFSGIIFAVIHGSLWSLAPLVVVGIGLAFIYEKSGSLAASMLAHFAFNSISTAAMLLISNAENL